MCKILAGLRTQLHYGAMILALGLLFARTARGQDSLSQQSAAKRVWPLPAVRAGTPAIVSVGMGAVYADVGDFVGPFISIEPGLRAGRASIGYSLVTGNLTAGTMVRGSFLRRYRGRSQGNYVGFEAQYVVALLGPRFGVFRSTRKGGGYLVAADVGIGF